MPGSKAFRYAIDAQNRIVEVDEPWLEFARSNGADDLTRNGVLGQRLDHYVIGWHAGNLYSQLFAVLRASGARVTIPFRCDAPDMRRYMALDIEPRAAGRLQFTGHLLRGVARPRVPLLDLALPRNEDWLSICAICRRISPDGCGWHEIEDGLDQPHAIPAAGLPRLSHNVCPDCTDMLRQAANARPAATSAD